jgi:hypothetical protein
MKNNQSNFNEHEVLHELKHFLPAQAPLKDFIHHNTLHSFQNLKFYDALHQAAKIFGFKTTLSLNDYRNLYQSGKIDNQVLENIITERKGKDELALWKDKLLNKQFDYQIDSRIGKLKANWKNNYKIDMDALVHPLLFRIVCSYLDQGIAIWNFPIEHKGFLSSIREFERMSYGSIFNSKRVRDLLLNNNCSLEYLLEILVGDETLFAQYLYDQQFAHQGWSGMVSFIEDNPNALLDTKKITLHNFANMGSYKQAVEPSTIMQAPDITKTRNGARTKYGLSLNYEQELNEFIGLFGQVSWNDGFNETWAFTEIDQSVSLSFSADGSNWKRNNDTCGIAFVADGISSEHQNYLKAGGKGFMIGDGNLNYAPEIILELFYNALLHEDHFWLSPDYQLVMNPAYNQDRGPAHVFAIRLHAEF